MTGQVSKAFLIAEVAQAHDGNLNIAHAFIEAVSKTGADAIKFQTHYAAEETSELEEWRTRFSRIDETRYGYWQRMEFTPEEWLGLARHASEVGLVFMSSSFSLKANAVLAACGMKYWKIASGELTNYPLVDDICRRNGKMILSCGLAEEAEIKKTVERIRARGGDVKSVLECTSKYPTPLQEINLERMVGRGKSLDFPFGLSDHSADTLPSIAAITLGANVIEVHVTMHEHYFGPDNSASLTLSQLSELAFARDRMAKLLSSTSIDVEYRKRMQSLFRKSIYVKRNLKAGHFLTIDDLAFRKPSASIGAEDYESVLGKETLKDLNADVALDWEDFK